MSPFVTAGGGFGPPGPTETGAAPFAVTGPTSVALDAQRAATASFTVSNVTGRPVRARLIPQPLSGADPAWLSVVGDAERPIGVAGTLTAEVRLQVPPTAPAGEHGMRLDVAVEDRPDLVSTGQSLTFSVPAPVKRRFPWWIVIVAAIAVVVLAIGGVVIWLATRGDPAPTNLTAPAISGNVVVGETLTVTPGTWQGGEPVEYRWETCDAADICENTGAASQLSYTVGDTDLDRRLKAIEIAGTGPRDTDTGEVPGPTAEVQSALTAVVQAPPDPTTIVPSVTGLTLSEAAEVLQANSLQALRVTTGTSVNSCNPIVVGQNPAAQATAPVGSAVAISVPDTGPFVLCFRLPRAPIMSTTEDAVGP